MLPAFKSGKIRTFARPATLEPWAFDAATEPSFGQNLNRTTLLSQIEALDYVDYIEDFYIENADKAVITKPPVSNVKIGRTVNAFTNTKAFIEPNDARTLLTAHQLTAQTPFETNNSITPL